MNKGDALWLLGFVILLSSVALGFHVTRDRVLRKSSPELTTQRWLEWQEATQAMASEPGPTTRTPLQTTEPPALTLLRDHYAACMFAVVTTCGVFFGVILWMLRGVLRQSFNAVPKPKSVPPSAST